MVSFEQITTFCVRICVKCLSGIFSKKIASPECWLIWKNERILKFSDQISTKGNSWLIISLRSYSNRKMTYRISGTPAGSDTTGVKAGVICLFSPSFFGVWYFFSALSFSLVRASELETSWTNFRISLIF